VNSSSLVMLLSKDELEQVRCNEGSGGWGG